MIKHPSGRPIRPREIKKPGYSRNPGVGPLVERLRPSGRLEGPIGFHKPERLDQDREDSR